MYALRLLASESAMINPVFFLARLGPIWPYYTSNSFSVGTMRGRYSEPKGNSS